MFEGALKSKNEWFDSLEQRKLVEAGTSAEAGEKNMGAYSAFEYAVNRVPSYYESPGMCEFLEALRQVVARAEIRWDAHGGFKAYGEESNPKPPQKAWLGIALYEITKGSSFYHPDVPSEFELSPRAAAMLTDVLFGYFQKQNKDKEDIPGTATSAKSISNKISKMRAKNKRTQ